VPQRFVQQARLLFGVVDGRVLFGLRTLLDIGSTIAAGTGDKLLSSVPRHTHQCGVEALLVGGQLLPQMFDLAVLQVLRRASQGSGTAAAAGQTQTHRAVFGSRQLLLRADDACGLRVHQLHSADS
jgi:hypothetical protein